MNSQTWDMPSKILLPEDIDFPEETYGICKKTRCFNEGELGNGICQSCWDKGSSGKSKETKIKATIPDIIISRPEQIIIVNSQGG